VRAPEFWRSDAAAGLDRALAHLLAPVGCLYAGAGRLRRALTTPVVVGVPVICVGNLVAGGAGKTPVTLSLAARLTARPALAGRVHLVTRGYGGKLAGPLRVNVRHDAGDVGDEALLLAAQAPTWVAHDRAAGARAAVAAGAGLLILDDGFQNPGLRKDLSLVVVDGAYGFGNGHVLPAGPLREPIADGLARADAVVLMGEDRTGLATRLAANHPDLPVLHARLVPTARAVTRLAGRRVFAFAGIGRPEKLFETLRGLGCALVGTRAFADHHPFAPAEIAALLDTAARADAVPVTTAKDAMRLSEDDRSRVEVLTVDVAWADEAALDMVLAAVLPEEWP